MSGIVPVLRAIVRDEVSAGLGVELGVVTAAATNDGGSGDRLCEVDVRLRGSDLVLQRVPVMAARVGVSAVPRVGDLVVVAFAGGDLHGAVVLGSLHTDTLHPPDAKPAELVYEVPDDAADGVRRAEIRLASGNTLTVEDNKVVIDLGGSVVTVDGGRVTIKASDGITFESGADVEIKADGNVVIKAGGNGTFEAGASMTAKGGTTAKLAGGATVTIAGITRFSQG